MVAAVAATATAARKNVERTEAQQGAQQPQQRAQRRKPALEDAAANTENARSAARVVSARRRERQQPEATENKLAVIATEVSSDTTPINGNEAPDGQQWW